MSERDPQLSFSSAEIAADRLTFLGRFLIALPYAALLFGGYSLVGKPVRPVVDAWLTPIDRVAPFVPWTAWLYLPGYTLCLVLTVYCLRPTRAFVAALVAFAALLVLAVPVFVLFPIRCGRVSPPTDPSATGWMLRFLDTWDTPYNTFPSLHIAMATLGAYVSYRCAPRIGPLVGGLAAGVCISVVTIRQHWTIDVLGGWVLALLGAWIWERCLGVLARSG